MRFYISGLLLILALMLFCKNVFGSAFSDPEVPDGEQIIWRTTKQGGKSFLSTVTWRIRTVDDEQLYEINVDSIEQGKAEYVLDKSDLQLIRADIQSKSEEGMSRIKIESKGNRQKLSHDLAGKLREKEIEYEQDSYSVHTLGFSLRGFPFNKQTEVKIKLIPPLKPDVPVWAWKMWDSYVKLLGEEKVTVPAGTFRILQVRKHGMAEPKILDSNKGG